MWCLSDGSKAGDWRLPTKEEWKAMGIANWKESDAFSGVQAFLYWSSTADDKNTDNAWAANLSSVNKKSKYHVCPVRG